nr:hypothetical protein [Tanacetum cinerariifolium]
MLKEYFDSVGISHQTSSVITPKQNGVVERSNYYSYRRKQLLLRATLKTAPLFTAVSTKHHTRSLMVENQISSFFMYSGISVILRMIMKTLENMVQKMILASSLVILLLLFKTQLRSMTSRQITLGLVLTYAPSTITTQQPTKSELDLLFEAMYVDYIGSQPSVATRTASADQAPQVL